MSSDKQPIDYESPNRLIEQPRISPVVKWFLIVFVLVGFAIIFFCGNLGILIR